MKICKCTSVASSIHNPQSYVQLVNFPPISQSLYAPSRSIRKRHTFIAQFNTFSLIKYSIMQCWMYSMSPNMPLRIFVIIVYVCCFVGPFYNSLSEIRKSHINDCWSTTVAFSSTICKTNSKVLGIWKHSRTATSILPMNIPILTTLFWLAGL